MDMNVGMKLQGFTVTRIRPISSVNADMIEMTHDQTGAGLVWFKRNDPNKTFMIGFKTIPEDSTGVFHILEHSVLNGSDRYPVKEPFVELLKCSMSTFLNAMTFPDKTIYPVSSRNEKDFFNLMNVYLDAVFCTAIHHNPNIFRQEGWHYHLPEEGAPAYQGVVYNEMKGALSDADATAMLAMQGMMFPDNCYRHESGGDPLHIPELTYEQFTASHRKFYHPSNSYVILDGDLPIEKTLKDIDSYLSRYQKEEKNFDIPMQALMPAAEREVAYAVAPNEPTEGRAVFNMARIACSWDEPVTCCALSALFDYLSDTNDSPLKKAILDKGLAQDVSLSLQDGILQPYFVFQAKNTTPANFDAIRDTVYATLRSLLEQGLDKEAIAAVINRMEFRSRERKEPAGIIFGITAFNAWLYGGDPAMYLQDEIIFAELRGMLDNGGFEQLIRDVLLDEAHMLVVKALPSVTLTAENQEQENQRLQAAMNAWTAEEKASYEAQMAELVTWQQTPDKEEDLAKLPTLTLADVPAEPDNFEPVVSELEGVTLLRRDSTAAGITYVKLGFEMNDLTLEEATDAELLVRFLGDLATRKHSAQELDQEIKSLLGRIHFDVMSISDVEDNSRCRLLLTVDFSALDINVDKAVALVLEMMTETRFDDTNRMADLIRQMDIGMRQSIVHSGHRVAIDRAASHHTASGMMNDALTGISYIRALHRLADAFTGEAEQHCEAMRKILARTMVSSRLTIGAFGSISDDQLRKIIAALPVGEKAPACARIQPDGKHMEAVIIPADVSYAGLAGNIKEADSSWNGLYSVMTSMMSFAYLWNAIRVQGGAYGAGITSARNGLLACYSYRDPTPGRSEGLFVKTADFLKDFCAAGQDLEQMIIGAVGSTDPLLGPAAMANTIFDRYMSGLSFEESCANRRKMLSATNENLAELVPVMRDVFEKASVCIVGSREAVEKSGMTLDIIEL